MHKKLYLIMIFLVVLVFLNAYYFFKNKQTIDDLLSEDQSSEIIYQTEINQDNLIVNRSIYNHDEEVVDVYEGLYLDETARQIQTSPYICYEIANEDLVITAVGYDDQAFDLKNNTSTNTLVEPLKKMMLKDNDVINNDIDNNVVANKNNDYLEINTFNQEQLCLNFKLDHLKHLKIKTYDYYHHNLQRASGIADMKIDDGFKLFMDVVANDENRYQDQALNSQFNICYHFNHNHSELIMMDEFYEKYLYRINGHSHIYYDQSLNLENNKEQIFAMQILSHYDYNFDSKILANLNLNDLQTFNYFNDYKDARIIIFTIEVADEAFNEY